MEYCILFVNREMGKDFKTITELNLQTDHLIITCFKKAQLNYNRIRTKFLSFLDIFFTVQFLDNLGIPFYFSWFYCFRGRSYPYAGLLSPQGCVLSQSLLEFFSTDESNSRFDKNTQNSYMDLQKKRWQLEGEKNFSKSFFKVKMEAKFLTSHCRFDVSNSGFQIFSALIGYEKGMVLTNFVQLKSENTLCKHDFYSDFMEVFLSKYKEYFEKIIVNKEELSFLIACKSFCNRVFLKDLLICFLYSQGHSSRVKQLTKAVHSSENFINISSKSKLEVFHSLSKLSQYFEKTFSVLYPEIYNVKRYLEREFILSSNIPLNKGIFLVGGADKSIYNNIFYSIKKDEEKRVSLRTGPNTKLTKSLKVSKNEFNKSKASSSITPNFIHYLDSIILSSVVCKCHKEGVIVLTAHDAFLTDLKNENKIKRFYYESFIEVILNPENNPIIFFFNANKVKFTRKELTFLKKIENDRQNLIASLNRDYKMSSFILSP